MSDLYPDPDYDSDENLPLRNPVYSVLVAGIPDRNDLKASLRRGLLDLDRPDLGHPHIPNLWERLREDTRPVEQRGMFCPECYEKDPDNPEWMYLRLREGRRESVHHNREHKSHSESPEHFAYKERYARAAGEDGHPVELEVLTEDGSVRSDVRVRGANGRIFGFEPQLSRIEAATVRRRQANRARNGITSIWHVVDVGAPLINQVHYTRADRLPAHVIKTHPDLMIRGGARDLRPYDCDASSPWPCPKKRVGRCGGQHPEWVSVERGFDSMVRDIASELWVPVTHKIGRHIERFFAKAEHRIRFQELGGILLDDRTGSPIPVQRTADPRDRLAECTRTRERTFQPGEKVIRDKGETLRPELDWSDPAGLFDAPLLNWKDSSHWAGKDAACVHCGKATQLRDGRGRPAHKVCAEQAA